MLLLKKKEKKLKKDKLQQLFENKKVTEEIECK